ncbi:MAG: hypothetical protein ACTSPB_14190 [Candidatus Thorarchaeota archaeon]
MRNRLFTFVLYSFLLASLFSGSAIYVEASNGNGIVEVEVPVRGTFLLTMDDWPYYGVGQYAYDEDLELQVGVYTDFRVEGPAIIDLQANGFIEGDRVYISWIGGEYLSGATNPSNPDSTAYGLLEYADIPWGGLLGLFSTTPQLSGIDTLHRVPGAIDFGDDYMTPDTYWTEGRTDTSDKLSAKGVSWYNGPMKTDIPEDFLITPYTGMEIIIPRNAKYLFLSTIDVYYRDNLEGPTVLTVTIEKDSDGDGLPDDWEINGIDVDDDGVIDLDLPMLGADWEHKDIFVEVDWGDYNDFYTRPYGLNAVVNSFAKAPVSNPDNIDGINLHILESEDVGTLPEFITWNDFQAIKTNYFGDLDERSKPSTIKAKKLVYHYCLFAYEQVGDSSGRGEIGGNDFFVSLGTSVDPLTLLREEAATFMHELGHNLGLRHGGFESVNYKPNYGSVMNYLFQFDHLVPTRPLDYSTGGRRVLDEGDLDETFGIGARTVTVWRGPDGRRYRSSGKLEIDWNNDGDIKAGVIVNLNDNPPEHPSVPSQTLEDYNDWENLIYRFRGLSSYASGTMAELPEELTLEMVEAMREEAKTIIEVTTTRVSREVSVGVKEGDWWEYAVTYTGDPPNYMWERVRIEVERIQGNNITLTWITTLLNGETGSVTYTYDFEIGVHDLFIIEANLDVGDEFYNYEWEKIVLSGTEEYGYAGEERTLVGSIVSDDWSGHWDKTTGVLTQADWEYSLTLHAKYVLDKTSLWGSQSSGLDYTLIVGLGVVVAAILLIVLFFIRRKKEKDQGKI